MTFRIPALVAALGVFGLAEVTPALAQPGVPVRPRYSSFQNIFRPGVTPLTQPGAGFIGQQMPIGNAAGPIAPGFAYPGLATFPQALPGAYQVDPQLPPTGVVGTYLNYGHWYGTPGSAGGLYGHWYPGGIGPSRGTNVGGSGGYGGSFAGTGLGGGARLGGSGAFANAAVTTGMAAGAINQMRK